MNSNPSTVYITQIQPFPIVIIALVEYNSEKSETGGPIVTKGACFQESSSLSDVMHWACTIVDPDKIISLRLYKNHVANFRTYE